MQQQQQQSQDGADGGGGTAITATAIITDGSKATSAITFQMKKKAKKKRKKKQQDDDDAEEGIREAFGDTNNTFREEMNSNNDLAEKEPLVIPVSYSENGGSNLRRRLLQATTSSAPAVKSEEAIKDGNDNVKQEGENDGDDDDLKAALALQREAAAASNGDKGEMILSNNSNRTIPVPASSSSAAPTLTTSGAAAAPSDPKTAEQCEKEEYEKDVAALPDALKPESEQYQSVPIAEFGAAMLRGMGWTGPPASNKRGRDGAAAADDDVIISRPHRLGLGAMPKDLPGSSQSLRSRRDGRPLTQNQKKRQDQLQKQQDEYTKQREAQIAQDKQRTLQAGSLVLLRSFSNDNGNCRNGHGEQKQDQGKQDRARVVQLQGVPGLNMVRVLVEGTSTPANIKRGRIERLLSRAELEERPFQEEEEEESNNNHEQRQQQQQRGSNSVKQNADANHHGEDRKRDRKKYNEAADKDSDSNKRIRSEPRRHDVDGSRARRDKKGKLEDQDPSHSFARRKRRHNADDEDDEKSRRSRIRRGEEEHARSHSSRPPPPVSTWMIPNIRVRVVTEKLGRRHYKQKGIVMDVTATASRGGRARATLQMDQQAANHHRHVLDDIPDRYLETALPKVGGRVIVLQPGDHLYAKGTLLERDSKRAAGTVQLYEDMTVLTLPLDDLAEWCGPLDEDIMQE